MRPTMNCPRCDGPVETYSLGDRRTSSCRRCGWVGVDVSFGRADEAGPSESWDDAIDRAAARDRQEGAGEAGTDEVLPSADVEPPAGDDGETTPDAEGDAVGGRDDSEGEPVEAVDGVGEDDAGRLHAAGVRTVDELASADAAELADRTDLPESRVREHVRRASIRLVASGFDGE